MAAIPNSVLGRISSLMTELNGEKTAADKKATELELSGSAKKDPGGYKGKSTHPSASASSNLQATPLGFRAKENETDVKKDHPGSGVDNVAPKSGGDQDSKQLNIGMHQSATGEDPKVEDAYKGDKDDKKEGDRGGTSHPANAEDVGEKYSSMHFDELSKLAYAKMNDVLADIVNGVHETDNKPASTVKASAAPNTQSTADASAQVTPPVEDKTEKLAAARAIIEQTMLDGQFNGDLVGEYLTSYAQNCDRLSKQAMEGPMGGAMEGETHGPMGPGADPQAGGPPPAGGAAPPPGAEGGDPSAGGGGDELDQFISTLLQMGHTPEEIEEILKAQLGGGEGGPTTGGPPPGAEGGDPSAGGPPMAPPGGGADMGKMGSAVREEKCTLLKVASAAKQRFRSGNWQMKTVSGAKQAQDRAALQNYIVEVCNAR